ncbi:MAG: DNA polymerase III subunit delta [Vulcanimicrobiaceae bacterium]|jgi:DNA polymerase III delta subunit
MKYYDFFDKEPKVDGLVVIEGEEPLLAQRALDALLDRLLPADIRALNCDVFEGPEHDAIGRAVADAAGAMPFLAERRVVVVRNCQRMRAQPRRDLWAAAEGVPPGNTLILEDLFAPAKKTKPEPFGQLAGRKALRIDTTPNVEVRERFVRETLARLGAKAQPRAIALLAEGSADLGAIQNDLEKLALTGTTITFADLERESVTVEDAKAWHYAQALVEGRPAEALAIAFDLFANDARGAAVPLASALANDFALLWALARGEELPPRHRWRERTLRPIARRIGERRARYGYEAAVRGFEGVVTGRIEDPRTMIELLTADLAVRLAR